MKHYRTQQRWSNLSSQLAVQTLANTWKQHLNSTVEESLPTHNQLSKLGMGTRGVIGDKWSGRILWVCAFGTAISLYMVAVDRQKQNRDRMLAESLKDMEAEAGSGETV